MRASKSIVGAYFIRPIFIASLALAMAITLSCSGDDSGGGDPSVSSSASTVCTSWSEGEVTMEPTCGKEGVKTLTCTSGISETKTEPIAKLPITSTQFCYKDSKIGDYCGDRTETFDPDLYKCEAGGKIYLKTLISYEGEDYEAVLIGTQTWLARNLNYAAAGSKCGKGSSLTEDASDCVAYGRLYNWATAMGGASVASSDKTPSGVQGVCPPEWHLPSNDEWNALMKAINPDCSDDDAKCDGAGKKLKATSGWNSNGNGTDDFGFAALPGGIGYPSGNFGYVGDNGYWWSASDIVIRSAYYRDIFYSDDGAYYSYNYKTYLFSVRCLQD